MINQTVAEVQAIVDAVTHHTNPDGSHPQIIVSAFTPILDSSGSLALSLYNSSLDSDLTGVDLWFTDNWDDFYDPDTDQARASLMYDTVHPNADGYAVMAENWFEAVNSLHCDLFGDVDCDCDVDGVDIMLVASRWRSAETDEDYNLAYDLDDDGDIDIVDITKVAAHWGETCE